MNKQELKTMLKPLIKECIKEVIFEDGSLSTIIKEVVKGTSAQQVVFQETKQDSPNTTSGDEQAKRLYERKKQLLDKIGKESFNGVDLFEGTTPMKNSEQQRQGALSGQDPDDAGVDIGAFAAKSSAIWQKMSGK